MMTVATPPRRRSLVIVAAAAIAIAAISIKIAHGASPPVDRATAATPLVVTMHARGIQPGEAVRLTVTSVMLMTALHARAFDRALACYAVTETTWDVLVGIDLDVAPGRQDVAIDAETSAGPVRTTYTLDVVAKSFPTRTLTVDEAYVNPPASVTSRIASEAAVLTHLWTTPTPNRFWAGGFVRPVAEPANSAFGSRSVFNGQARSPHGGADFLSPAGTPVHAPAAGHVVVARELYYTGNTVVIDHGQGLLSLFAHFSRIDVHDGDRVAAGDVVGLVGATGRVTGPHLHWAVRLNNARVDPLSLLAVLAADGTHGAGDR